MRKCKHYLECQKYVAMTLDQDAIDCENCPAYQPRSLLYLLKGKIFG